jgi:hypothetical protein
MIGKMLFHDVPPLNSLLNESAFIKRIINDFAVVKSIFFARSSRRMGFNKQLNAVKVS